MITLTFTAHISEQLFYDNFEESQASYTAEKKGKHYYSFDVQIPKCWFVKSADTFKDFLCAIREYFIAFGDLQRGMPTPIPVCVEGEICSEEYTKDLLLELNNYTSKNDAFLVQMTNRECWEDECTKILGVFTDIKMAKDAIREEMKGETITPYLDWIQEIKFNKVID